MDGRIAYGIMESKLNECGNMGGAWNPNPPDHARMSCHLNLYKEVRIQDDCV